MDIEGLILRGFSTAQCEFGCIGCAAHNFYLKTALMVHLFVKESLCSCDTLGNQRGVSTNICLSKSQEAWFTLSKISTFETPIWKNIRWKSFALLNVFPDLTQISENDKKRGALSTSVQRGAKTKTRSQGFCKHIHVVTVVTMTQAIGIP